MWQGPTLSCLSERPFRTHHPLLEGRQWISGGSLRKFLRGLSQFPFSFPVESRWGPAPAAKSALDLATLNSFKMMNWPGLHTSASLPRYDAPFVSASSA